MERNLGLVAGSHNSNEFIIIRQDGDFLRDEWKGLCGEVCQLCGEEIGVTEDGDLFVACNECAFPVCRSCYHYERREGTQLCPQCKTRYKRLKGCARVEGDEEEDDIDDLENEFEKEMHVTMPPPEDDETSQEHHHHNHHNALVPSYMMSKEIIGLQARAMDPSKDLAAYGYGSVAWKERMELWKQRQQRLEEAHHHHHQNNNNVPDDDTEFPLMDEARQPLSRKMAIASSKINPYRMMIIIRVVVVAFYFHYRVTHPVENAYALWLVSVICEIWFTLAWILDQFPKWFPVQRETYLDRLSLRYEKEGEGSESELSAIDIFVSTVDPQKEPPLVTANTVLSVLAVDYPADKVSCYVSDDGAAMLTFEALSETSEFAKKWVPFCKKFNVEPRAPEWYFAEKINYLKDKVHPSFVRERRAMKREYEEFRVRMNCLVAKAGKVPEEGWTMQDGTPWPGNSVCDHPGMIQVFLGKSGGHDKDGNELPPLVYVSRERRPTFNHHRKAGALNSLVRVSAVLSNAPFVLNLEYDNYINNSKAIREAMCFMMDPLLGQRVCYVQFSHRFTTDDANNDSYDNQTTAFTDVNMKGLDGIQGPTCIGIGCVMRREALYGYDAPRRKKGPSRTCNCWSKCCCCCGWCCMGKRKRKKKCNKHRLDIIDSSHRKVHSEASIHQSALNSIQHITPGTEGETLDPTTDEKLAKQFGQSPIFIASTQLVDGEAVKHGSLASLLTEAIHVISCGYEEKTEWGKEVGWIYGSIKEDILTGFKMHCHGWKSIYCIPERAAFRVFAPRNLANYMQQVFESALGSIEIFMSKHCPLWHGYGGGLKWLERIFYVNSMLFPFTSIPLLAYCTLPAVCLLTDKFIIPQLSSIAGMWFLSLFICIFTTCILEMRWSRVTIHEWWRNQQFWVMGGISAHLFALFIGLFKVLVGVNTNMILKKDNDHDHDHSELFALKWTTFLIVPTTLLMLNIIAIVAGVSHAINNGFESWGPLIGKLLFSLWVVLHLYPLLRGMMHNNNRTPTIVLVWSILLASFFSVLWVKIDPFLPKSNGPILEECGLDCN